MLSVFARAFVSRVVDPMGRALVRAGLTPNTMTVIGTLGTSGSAVLFFPRGMLLAGTFTVWAFAMLDILDGAMARAKGRSTAFGAVLDSTGDRLADGALFAALVWWCLLVADNRSAAVAALIALVLAQIISYVKARAETCGLSADGGLIERPERLIIALVGTGLQGFGVPHMVELSLWLLVVLSTVTLVQRSVAAHRSAQEADR